MFLYTDMMPQNGIHVHPYLATQMNNADVASEFGQNLRRLKNILDIPSISASAVEEQILPILLEANYNVILAQDEGIFGHLGFQKHGRDWKVFVVAVDRAYRNRGYGQALADFAVSHARTNGAASVQFGNGNSQALDSLVSKAFSERDDLRLEGRTVYLR